MMSQQFTCCICLPKDQSVKKLSTKARVPTEGPERQEVINKGQSAYRRTRASRSHQQRPERLPKDQSVKKLSTEARAPTEGPERQQVINKGQSAYRRARASKGYQQGQSAYRRTRASRSHQQRPERLPKDQSVKKLSTEARAPTEGPERQQVINKARVPTEGPERQEVIDKGQSAYRRTRASTSYQQRPERLPKDQSVRKLSTTTRVPKGSGQQKRSRRWKPHADRTFLYDEEGRTRPLSEQERRQEANHETTCDEEITTPNAR